MQRTRRIVLVAAIASTPWPLFAQSILKPQTPIQGGPLTPKSAALEKAPIEVICHGGPGLRVDPAGPGKHAVYFQQSRAVPDSKGTSLNPGECSPVNRLFAATEPPGIQFADKAGEESIATHFADPNRFWRLSVVDSGRGYFEARSYQRVLVIADPAPADAIAKKIEPAKESDAAKKPDVPIQSPSTPPPNPAEKAGLNPQPLPPKQPADISQQPAANAASQTTAQVARPAAEKPAEKATYPSGPPTPPPVPNPEPALLSPPGGSSASPVAVEPKPIPLAGGREQLKGAPNQPVEAAAGSAGAPLTVEKGPAGPPPPSTVVTPAANPGSNVSTRAGRPQQPTAPDPPPTSSNVPANNPVQGASPNVEQQRPRLATQVSVQANTRSATFRFVADPDPPPKVRIFRLGRWGQQEEIVEVAATARAQQPGNPAETVLTASSGDRLEPNTVYIFAIEAGFLRPWTIYRGRFRTLPERKPNEAR